MNCQLIGEELGSIKCQNLRLLVPVPVRSHSVHAWFSLRRRLISLSPKLTSTQNKIGFLQISPYGKVPVLRHGDAVIVESAVINEYLDEEFPQKPLMPKTPGDRAKARIWIDFANVRFVPQIYKMLLAQDRERQSEHADKLTTALLMMEHEGLAIRTSGPYWLGEELSLVDFTFYPHLQRFCALDYYRDFQIPEECKLLKIWLRFMEENRSVQMMQISEDVLIRNWEKYALNTSTGTTAEDMREAS